MDNIRGYIIFSWPRGYGYGFEIQIFSRILSMESPSRLTCTLLVYSGCVVGRCRLPNLPLLPSGNYLHRSPSSVAVLLALLVTALVTSPEEKLAAVAGQSKLKLNYKGGNPEPTACLKVGGFF